MGLHPDESIFDYLARNEIKSERVAIRCEFEADTLPNERQRRQKRIEIALEVEANS